MAASTWEGCTLPADARRRQAHGYRNKNRRTVLFRESDGGSAVKPGPLWALTRPSGVGLWRAARCPAEKRGKNHVIPRAARSP